MKIVINPQYNQLQPFIQQIPSLFNQEGELVYTARNQLKMFEVSGYQIIVKRYKVPHIINRIAYTILRRPKAQRAYEYALELLRRDVASPAPIAYLLDFKGGLLAYSYFISIYEGEYADVRDLMLEHQQDDDLLKELAEYIAYFHDKGVLHLDMSPGNILYKKQAGSNTLFTLIDINRMQFPGNITEDVRYKSFRRLSPKEGVLTKLATHYAAAAGLSKEHAITEINRYCAEFFNSRKFKRRK